MTGRFFFAPSCLRVKPLTSAPRPPAAGIPARQPLADQLRADVRSVHPHVAQLAAVAVLVAVDARQCDRPRIEQLLEAPGCGKAQLPLARAAGRMRLGRVDVGDADPDPVHPEGVAIADAIPAAAGVAAA